ITNMTIFGHYEEGHDEEGHNEEGHYEEGHYEEGYDGRSEDGPDQRRPAFLRSPAVRSPRPPAAAEVPRHPVPAELDRPPHYAPQAPPPATSPAQAYRSAEAPDWAPRPLPAEGPAPAIYSPVPHTAGPRKSRRSRRPAHTAPGTARTSASAPRDRIARSMPPPSRPPAPGPPRAPPAAPTGRRRQVPAAPSPPPAGQRSCRWCRRSRSTADPWSDSGCAARRSPSPAPSAAAHTPPAGTPAPVHPESGRSART